MPRPPLPIVGGDRGTWGTKLNAVLTDLQDTALNKLGDTMTGPLIIDATSASELFRIIQRGAGGYFNVQDLNGINVLRMLNNGRVGLGYTGAPEGLLHIQSPGNVRSLVLQAAIGQSHPLLEMRSTSGAVIGEILVSSHVAAPLRDRGGQVYNVLTYAATATQRDMLGNGASKPLSGYYGTLADAQVAYPLASALTDELDWAVMQKAETAANVAGGGIVHVPVATGWIVNRAVKLHSRLTLEGNGRGSLIKLRDGVNINTRVIENNNTSSSGTDKDIVVRNLAVDGNGPNQTTGGSAIAFNYVTRGLIENCFVQNGYSHNIYAAEGCDGILVIGNWCLNSYNAGNITGAYSRNLLYANNYANAPGRAQYKFDGIDYLTVVGNIGEGGDVNVAENIGFYMILGSHTLVANNNFHNLARGMQWVGADHILATGNVIHTMQQSGVKLMSGANFATITNNTIIDVGIAAANTHDGIQVAGVDESGVPVSASTDVLILGNRIHDTQATKTMRHGVYAASNSDNIKVDHNPISGSLSSPVSLLGTNSSHRDNPGVGDESVSRGLDESYTEDDFVSGSTTSGAIGELRWMSANGLTSADTAAAGRPGIVRRDTSTTSGQYAYTMLANASAGPITPADNFDVTYIFRLNQADTDTLARIGLASAAASNPPGNGVYLEKLAADTEWQAVTRGAGVQTRTPFAPVATVTAAAWVKLRIRRASATQIGFTLNGGTEVLVTTNLPTVPLNPFFAVHNAVAASKTIDVDYFSALVTGLNR